MWQSTYAMDTGVCKQTQEFDEADLLRSTAEDFSSH